MLKKYEVETIIKDALLELDGILSDKPNEDGTYDLFFADVSEDEEHNIFLTFDTYIGNEKIETDRYKIKVEYIVDDPKYFEISKDGMTTAKEVIADDGIEKLCTKDCIYGSDFLNKR